MTCKQCGTEYTPLKCPSCGQDLGDGICPACSPNGQVVCSHCNSTVQFRQSSVAAQNPIYEQPAASPLGYTGYVAPTEKVKFKGWLLGFAIFHGLLLLYNIGSFLFSMFTNNIENSSIGIGSLIFSAIISIVPLLLVMYFLLDRNSSFKTWFIVQFIIQVITTVLSVFGYISMTLLLPKMQTQGVDMETITSQLPDNYKTTLLIATIFAVLLTLAELAWLIYIFKSKQVAYACNPLNNPPKK